jgi:lipopolysaccharide assembly outer membrane protein LptD (OstA)
MGEILRVSAREIIAKLILSLAICGACLAQEIPVQTIPQDTLLPDTLIALHPDTTLADTLPPAPAKDEVDTLVSYSADSIDFDVINRVSVLLGNATVRYKDMEIQAGVITVDWNRQLLTAGPFLDTLWTDSTQTVVDTILSVGEPMFRQMDDQFTGDSIVYSMKTRRGRVEHGQTHYLDGYYYGERFKRMSSEEVTVGKGEFTTCDHKPPHYHFASNRMKVIVGDKVVARPVYLYFEDVPTMAIPYGVFPNRKGRQSGLIFPKFGESWNQGRFLQDVGYYWAPSDYMDLTGSFDYYERFGFLGRADYRYALRYILNGFVNFSFDMQRQETRRNRRWALALKHNQTLDPYTQLTVSGNFASDGSYNDRYATTEQRLRQSLNSNATLTHRWPDSPWSVSMNLHHEQNLTDNTWSASLPNIALRHGTGKLFPGPKLRRGEKRATSSTPGEEPWYRVITYDYSASFMNSVTYKKESKLEGYRITPRRISTGLSSRENINGDLKWTTSQRDGIQHRLGFGATARLLRYFNLNPRWDITEDWSRRAVEFVPRGRTFDREERSGFFARHTFNLSTAFKTKLYGTFLTPFGIGADFRHVLDPTISFSYRPDFSDKAWSYYKTARLPSGVEYEYDRFSNFLYGGTSRGRSERLSFSLGNLFQMRTGHGENMKKSDLFTLNSSTAVDFARDSLRWADLTSSFRTSTGGALFGPIQSVSLDISTIHSFYQMRNRVRVNQFFWDRPGGTILSPLELRSLSTSISFGMKEDHLGGTFGVSEKAGRALDSIGTAAPEPKTATLFDRPYSANFSFYHTWDFENDAKTTWMNAEAELELTRNWKISYDTRVDLETMDVVSAAVQIHRDMHCWEGTLSWNPIGIGQGYYVRIALKSPQLRDVKVERTRGRGTFRGF